MRRSSDPGGACGGLARSSHQIGTSNRVSGSCRSLPTIRLDGTASPLGRLPLVTCEAVEGRHACAKILNSVTVRSLPVCPSPPPIFSAMEGRSVEYRLRQRVPSSRLLCSRRHVTVVALTRENGEFEVIRMIGYCSCNGRDGASSSAYRTRHLSQGPRDRESPQKATAAARRWFRRHSVWLKRIVPN